ncbi:MAG: hypothetical protein JO097_07575 [Acidobacteriaceae bacterium]|nr:hypothetical protein [Acidobacteriaceae bacterium]MBV9766706.1 hypothetical protein [Acidobacteriaceae bacterium]
MPDDPIVLPDPSQRPELEPFATIYAEVIVPEATLGRWFEEQRVVPPAELDRITRRIETLNQRLFGHSVHPAVYVYPLLVCCHFFFQSTAADVDLDERRLEIADAAFSLTQNLLHHHRLNDLYLLL